MIWLLLTIYSLLLLSCSATAVVDEGNNTIAETSNNTSENIECEEEDIPCDELSEWAYEFYEEEDYNESINYAKQAIACNCATSNAGKIYSSLAKSYVALGEGDVKIASTIKKGLSYDPENIDLVELAIWNAKRLNDANSEISNLELLLSLDKSINNFKRLSDVYRKERQYKNQERIVKDWLNLFPDDNDASQELKLLYSKQGKDEFHIDKERCEKNPDNFDYCFNYAKGLARSARFEEALKELNKMLKKYPSNETLMKKTAEVYLDNYDQNEALILYKKLVRINSKNIDYLLSISKIYQDIEKFRDAHKWAKKAINASNNNNKLDALVNYAELLKNSVESCSEESLSLEDKAVYEISYKYYRLAYKNGHTASKNMIDWFKNNKKTLLPTLEDWFLMDTDLSELKPIEINPNRKCYVWVEETVQKIQ